DAEVLDRGADDVRQEPWPLLQRDDRHRVRHGVAEARMVHTVEHHEREDRPAPARQRPFPLIAQALGADVARREPVLPAGGAALQPQLVPAARLPERPRLLGWDRDRLRVRLTHGALRAVAAGVWGCPPRFTFGLIPLMASS